MSEVKFESGEIPKVVTTHYNYGDGYIRSIVTRGFDRKGHACNNGPYTEFYNAAGEKVKKKGSFKNGRIDGELLEYYQDGKLQCRSCWNEGAMITLEEYDQNGVIIKKMKG